MLLMTATHSIESGRHWQHSGNLFTMLITQLRFVILCQLLAVFSPAVDNIRLAPS